jgi:lysozyme family protein
MANFNEAYDITLGHEGGYSNDPDDVGGETYKGVARAYYPNWVGWTIIDDSKSINNFPNNLRGNTALDAMIREFYKDNYWNLFWGDQIPNQEVANELFDTGVNMGVGRAVKYLQKALNVLNRNQKNYGDIVEDGGFGVNTMTALNQYLAIDDESYLVKVINILQGMHYIDYMTKSPTQEKFARGWLKRVSINKNF